jgi:hypothetical protein
MKNLLNEIAELQSRIAELDRLKHSLEGILAVKWGALESMLCLEDKHAVAFNK